MGARNFTAAVAVESAACRLGPTGYTTDEGAFDAINAGTRQGVIYQ